MPRFKKKEKLQELERVLTEEKAKEPEKPMKPSENGKVKFFSRHAALQVVMVPGTWKFDAGGNRYPVAGKILKFRNGSFETDDKKEIEFLRQHEYYRKGKIIDSQA